MSNSVFDIAELRNDILQSARERQERVARGEYEVPVRYRPLPLAELTDYFGQWAYRRDSLELAVPPAGKRLGERFSRWCKSIVCQGLRWLLIRQVEFNTAALRHGGAVAELLAAVDRNQAEFVAALSSLKLQVHTLRKHLAQLESSQPITQDAGAVSAEPPHDLEVDLPAHQLYLSYLVEGGIRVDVSSREGAPVVVLGCGRGDLLRYLVAEGVSVQGVDADCQCIEYCRERELPATHAGLTDYINTIANDTLGGIVLERRASPMPARQLSGLLAQCWTKLKKGGVLIAEAETPLYGSASGSQVPRLPVELLQFLLENHCFTVIDTAFVRPVRGNVEPVQRISEDRPFDMKHYRHYAVIGRK